MEDNIIKAEFQIGKNYIQEFNMNIIDRNFPEKKNYSYNLKVGLSEITNDEKYQYASVFLVYHIFLKEKEKEYLNIYIKSIGEFRATSQLDTKKFQEYCKYNGAPMVSQNIRAYLKAVTALSDIEPINVPFINFKEVFKERNKERK